MLHLNQLSLWPLVPHLVQSFIHWAPKAIPFHSSITTISSMLVIKHVLPHFESVPFLFQHTPHGTSRRTCATGMLFASAPTTSHSNPFMKCIGLFWLWTMLCSHKGMGFYTSNATTIGMSSIVGEITYILRVSNPLEFTNQVHVRVSNP